MKKLKFLPSILMLVLSVAVLAFGVYAATPSTNTVTGSIKVNSSAYPISISCLIDGDEIESHSTLRAGITWTKGLSTLTFNTDTALYVEEVEPIKLTFRITNLSNVELGAYFYTGTGLDDGNLATASSVMVEDTIKDSSGETTIVHTYLSSYSYIAPNTSEFSTVDMNVVLMLADFIYETKELSFSYILNIEEYIPNTSVLDEFESNSDSGRLAPSNPFVKIASNVKDSDGNVLTGIPAYAINSEYVEICVIPSTLTTIGRGALYRDASGAILRGVTIPDSIISVAGLSADGTWNYPGYYQIPKNVLYCNGVFGNEYLEVYAENIEIPTEAFSNNCRVVKFYGNVIFGDSVFQYGSLMFLSLLGTSASLGNGMFHACELKQIVIGSEMEMLTSQTDFNAERIIVQKGETEIAFDVALPEVSGKSWYLNGQPVAVGTKLQKSTTTDNVYTCK